MGTVTNLLWNGEVCRVFTVWSEEFTGTWCLVLFPRKAAELKNLLNVKAGSVSVAALRLTDTASVVLCLDMAGMLHSQPVDKVGCHFETKVDVGIGVYYTAFRSWCVPYASFVVIVKSFVLCRLLYSTRTGEMLFMAYWRPASFFLSFNGVGIEWEIQNELLSQHCNFNSLSFLFLFWGGGGGEGGCFICLFVVVFLINLAVCKAVNSCMKCACFC